MYRVFVAFTPLLAALPSVAHAAVLERPVLLFDDGKSEIRIMEVRREPVELSCGDGETMFLRELGDKISWQPDVSEVTFVKCLGKDVQATDVAAVLKNTSDKVSGSLGASGAHVSSMISERIAFLLFAEIRASNTAG